MEISEALVKKIKSQLQHVQVSPKRKAVWVKSFGQPPFAQDDQKAWIPDGAVVLTKVFSKWFWAETHVQEGVDGNNKAFYRCTSLDSNCSTEWSSTPTEALDRANVNNRKYVPGYNGRLQFAIAYPNLQAILLEQYGHLLQVKNKSLKRTLKVELDEGRMDVLETTPCGGAKRLRCSSASPRKGPSCRLKNEDVTFATSLKEQPTDEVSEPVVDELWSTTWSHLAEEVLDETLLGCIEPITTESVAFPCKYQEAVDDLSANFCSRSSSTILDHEIADFWLST